MFGTLVTIFEVMGKIPTVLGDLPGIYAAILKSPKWIRIGLICVVASIILGLGLWRIHHAVYESGYNKAKAVDAAAMESMRGTMQEMIRGETKDTAYVRVPVYLPAPKPPTEIAGTVEVAADSVRHNMNGLEDSAKTQHDKYVVADSMARFYVLPWTSFYEDSVQNLSMQCNPVTKTTLAKISYKLQFPLVPQITTTLGAPSPSFFKTNTAYFVYGGIGTTVVYYIGKSLIK